MLMDGNPITDEEVVRLLNQAEELKNSVQDVADFDLGFALCHIDHAGTRRGVKKSQEKLRSLLGYNVLGCNATD